MVVTGVMFPGVGSCVGTMVTGGVGVGVAGVSVPMHPALKIQTTTAISMNTAIPNLAMFKTPQEWYINIGFVTILFQKSETFPPIGTKIHD